MAVAGLSPGLPTNPLTSVQMRAHPVRDHIRQSLTILTCSLSRCIVRVDHGFSPKTVIRSYPPQNRDHFLRFIDQRVVSLSAHAHIRVSLVQRQVRVIPPNFNTQDPDDDQTPCSHPSSFTQLPSNRITTAFTHPQLPLTVKSSYIPIPPRPISTLLLPTEG